MTTHARLSPSSAERWLNCPASPAVGELYPSTSSAYADEGTAAHLLASWALEAGNDAAAYVGRVIEVPSRDGGKPRRFVVDGEMADHVQSYLDNTRTWLQFAGAVLLVEQRLPIESTTGEPGARGTTDAAIIVPRGESNDLVVRDLKYGRGVRVAAKGNRQLLIYAQATYEAAALGYDFDDSSVIRIEIDQPRIGNYDSWAITLADLRREIAEIRKGAKVALATGVDGKRVAGDWCKFCPAAADCPTRAAYVAEAITGSEGFEVFTKAGPLPAPDRSKLALYLSKVQAIRDWCASVEEQAHAVLLSGGEVPGFKLVLGQQGHRKWTDEQAAETFLISHGAPRAKLIVSKLASPTQAEKLIPKEARPMLAEYTTRSAPQPLIAPQSDERPAYTATDASGFTAADDAASLL